MQACPRNGGQEIKSAHAVDADVTRVANENYRAVNDDNLDSVIKLARNCQTAAVEVRAELSVQGWKNTTSTSTTLVPLVDVVDVKDAGSGLLIGIFKSSPIVDNKQFRYVAYRCPSCDTVLSFVDCFVHLHTVDSGCLDSGGRLEERLLCRPTDVISAGTEATAFDNRSTVRTTSSTLHVPELPVACQTFDKSFRHKRTHLVDSIDPSDKLLNLLLDREVLTQEQVTEVKNFSGKNQRNERLLDLLSRRPDDRFPAFIVVLIETDQGHLAEFVAEAKYKEILEANPRFRANQLRAKSNLDSAFTAHSSKRLEGSFRSSTDGCLDVDHRQPSIKATWRAHAANGSVEVQKGKTPIRPADPHFDDSWSNPLIGHNSGHRAYGAIILPADTGRDTRNICDKFLDWRRAVFGCCFRSCADDAEYNSIQ